MTDTSLPSITDVISRSLLAALDGPMDLATIEATVTSAVRQATGGGRAWIDRDRPADLAAGRLIVHYEP